MAAPVALGPETPATMRPARIGGAALATSMNPVAARGASPTSMAMMKHTTVTMTAPLTVDTAP